MGLARWTDGFHLRAAESVADVPSATAAERALLSGKQADPGNSTAEHGPIEEDKFTVPLKHGDPAQSYSQHGS